MELVLQEQYKMGVQKGLLVLVFFNCFPVKYLSINSILQTQNCKVNFQGSGSTGDAIIF